MVTNDPGAPVLAQAASSPGQGVPGAGDFDHGPISNALENHLQDWLNRPVQDILNQFHMGQLPDVGAHDFAPSLAGGAAPNQLASGSGGMGGGNNMIGGMLKPATDLLGTVGNGVFQGLNPSQLFGGVTQAFQQAAGGLQQALGSMMSGAQGWGGQGATGAATATGQTLAHGAATAAQGAGLAGHYTAAAADSSQGYSRILEAIQQGQDELSALAGGLPWTGANMAESASRTTANVTAIVTELQGTLAAQAGATAATGAPVEAATQGPQSAMSMLSPLMSVGMSMMGPAMQVGMMPMTIGMQAGMQALQAGTSLMSSAGKGAGGAGAGAASTLASTGTRLASAGAHVGGGAGGGAAAVTPARAVAGSPMIQRETAAAVTSSSVARPAVGGAGMGGAGMMGGGGMAGQHGGKAGAGDGNHTTASFLHTSDQGGEIVGDLGTASPPVIGEADPNADPDVKLRI